MLLKTIKLAVIRKLKNYILKTKFEWVDSISAFVEKIGWPGYLVLSLYVATRPLQIPDLAQKVFHYLLLFIGIIYAIKAVFAIIDYMGVKQAKKNKEHDSEQDNFIIRVFSLIAKGIFIAIALLFILANVGFNIGSLLAGLGIGGIAIAFALQNILTDLFSSFTIYFDKPFREGDFIVVGSDSGTVKKIGLKSTRIQTLRGEDLIISNREMTTIRVNNFKEMEDRRIIFNFGVEYGTKKSKLRKINTIVRKTLKEIKKAYLSRVHFKEFGDFSLNYEVVYYVDAPEYDKYMDVQQKINFALVEAFEKEKINFAFPTQTVFVKKE